MNIFKRRLTQFIWPLYVLTNLTVLFQTAFNAVNRFMHTLQTIFQTQNKKAVRVYLHNIIVNITVMFTYVVRAQYSCISVLCRFKSVIALIKRRQHIAKCFEWIIHTLIKKLFKNLMYLCRYTYNNKINTWDFHFRLFYWA